MTKLPEDWQEKLCKEFRKPYYQKLRKFLKDEYENETIFPAAENIYNAFRLTPLNKVKVVIIGQDPYIKPEEAHGLSFSVNKGVTIPPSLRNIYKAVENDIGCKMPNHGCLTEWAKQGVLLLNNVLTVRKGESNSHKGKGWELLTEKIITILNCRHETEGYNKDPIVFMLWGKAAQEKERWINPHNHLILKYVHPSPLAGDTFKNCKHFSQANKYLSDNGVKPIDWKLL